MNFRNSYQRAVDQAHSNLASAEMMRAHSFTREDIQETERDVIMAKLYLERAEQALEAYNAQKDSMGDYD